MFIELREPLRQHLYSSELGVQASHHLDGVIEVVLWRQQGSIKSYRPEDLVRGRRRRSLRDVEQGALAAADSPAAGSVCRHASDDSGGSSWETLRDRFLGFKMAVRTQSAIVHRLTNRKLIILIRTSGAPVPERLLRLLEKLPLRTAVPNPEPSSAIGCMCIAALQIEATSTDGPFEQCRIWSGLLVSLRDI